MPPNPHILSWLASIIVSESGGGEGAPRVPNDPAATKLDLEPWERVLSDQIQVLGEQFQRPQRLGQPSRNVVKRIATALHSVRSSTGSMQTTCRPPASLERAARWIADDEALH